MSARFKRKHAGEGGEQLDPREAAPADTDPDPSGSAPSAESIEELAEQRDRYLEMWQRANADYQNLRRRGLTDMEAAARRAKESLLHDILRVLDYMDMALATECHSEEGRNLLVGVRMTRDELSAVLEREGVRPVPEGGAFDPRIHQAVATVETDQVEPGQVVATVRRGYVLGEHPLRHAQVQVSASPAGDAEPAPDTPQNAEPRE